MSTPREDRAAARDGRRNLNLPNIGLGRADLHRSRSPSPIAPGTFNFPPPPSKKSAGEVEEEQFGDAMADATATNMPGLTVDDIVKIATASAQAAAREFAAATPPQPAAPATETTN